MIIYIQDYTIYYLTDDFKELTIYEFNYGRTKLIVHINFFISEGKPVYRVTSESLSINLNSIEAVISFIKEQYRINVYTKPFEKLESGIIAHILSET